MSLRGSLKIVVCFGGLADCLTLGIGFCRTCRSSEAVLGVSRNASPREITDAYHSTSAELVQNQGANVPSNFWPMFTRPTPLFWVQEFLDFEPHTRQRVPVDVIPAEVWHSRPIQTSLPDQRKPSKRSLRPTKSSQMRWMVKWKINVYTRFLSVLTI